MDGKLFNADAEALLTQLSDHIVLEQLMDTAPLGIGVFDREFRYRKVNQVLADINGKSIAEHQGKLLREVVPHHAQRRALCGYRHLGSDRRSRL